MTRDDTSWRMPWEPDMDTALRLTWLTAGLFFLLFLVSLIGELLGWWNLIGEIGMGVGAAVSILLTLIGVLAGAGRQQVDAVGDDVRGVRYAVLANGVRLQKLDKLDKLDDLDRVQAELDAQTGVLGEQLTVLSAIREKL